MRSVGFAMAGARDSATSEGSVPGPRDLLRTNLIVRFRLWPEPLVLRANFPKI